MKDQFWPIDPNLNSGTLAPETLADYRFLAQKWIETVVPADASSLEKVIHITRQSIIVLKNLLWLRDEEPIPSNIEFEYPNLPKELWRPMVYGACDYWPDDLWLHGIMQAVELAHLSHPMFERDADLRSWFEGDPGFYERWPTSPRVKFLSGAGSSVVEAVARALGLFLTRIVRPFLICDDDDSNAVSSYVVGLPYGQDDLGAIEVWPCAQHRFLHWKSATLDLAKKYFPRERWSLADIDGECMLANRRLDEEIMQVFPEAVCDRLGVAHDRTVASHPGEVPPQDARRPQTPAEFATPTQPPSRTQEEIEAILAALRPAARKAYATYGWAVRQLEEIGQTTPADKEVYTYLEENTPEDYTLPSFATWSGHLRRARNALGEQKKRPRNVATAPMAKASDDPAILSQISHKYVRD